MFINEPNHYDENLDRTGRTIDKERGISLVRLGGGGERPDLFALLIGEKQIAFEAVGHKNNEARAIEWEVRDIGQGCMWFGTKKGATHKISKHHFENQNEYIAIGMAIEESLRRYTQWHGIIEVPVLTVNIPNYQKPKKK